MTARALIHIAGPKDAGKTTFAEAILANAPGVVLATRCHQDDSLRRIRETRPRAHPELRRYREAGAFGVALLEFPQSERDSDAFFDTDLMADDSEGVLIEGDTPFAFVDLTVFVAPPLPPGQTLLERRWRDRAQEARAGADALEKLLQEPDGFAQYLGNMSGPKLAEFARANPALTEKPRALLLEGIAQVRRAPPLEPTEHWAVAAGCEGIERAQLVVVNVRSAAERERGEQLASDVRRLRSDATVFNDVMGLRGSKIPITIVVANLADPKDAGRKKALARVRRALQTRS